MITDSENAILSKKQHWDSIYKHISHKKPRFESYSDHYLINLCRKYIPRNQDSKFIEIGCAPGHNIVLFNKHFGFQPFGVDYSEKGYELTIKTFIDNRFSPDNIFLNNFLSSEFQECFREHFDVVSSFGFLEHFKDPNDIISKHLNILKPGGYLIITIPNLRGINGLISEFLNPGITKIHNLNIMDKSNFSVLFNRKDLELAYCGYYGVFTFGLFNTPEGSNKRIFMHIAGLLQIGLIDRVFERVLLNRNIECKEVSPFLIYIGRKL